MVVGGGWLVVVGSWELNALCDGERGSPTAEQDVVAGLEFLEVLLAFLRGTSFE